MRFHSTRSEASTVSFSDAIQTGLAPDGGLYVPESFPTFTVADFDGLESWVEIGERVLEPFFKGDELHSHLGDICREAFNFPLALRDLDDDTSVLELFHGPTAAFKDVGARFLASCIARLPGCRTVLVATSGDTGGAVAAAFHEHSNVKVIVLFPQGKVSPRQQQQLTCWGDNVCALAVRGDFDDCQRIVKAAFMSSEWSEGHVLMSANSINLGRLLPQTVYYAAAGLWYLRRHGKLPGFIVPTGNLGNGVAALWAQKMRLPVRAVVLACNANSAVPNFLHTGSWSPQPTIATIANAMDVGNPSNMERLRALHPEIATLRQVAQAFSVSDEEIGRAITSFGDNSPEALCPHTAAAAFVRKRLASHGWVIVATAHPAKFELIVEPLIRRAVTVPPSLARLLELHSSFEEIDPTFAALTEAIR